MTFSLHSLLESVGLEFSRDLSNPEIKSITCDSRHVHKGSLFIGLPGERIDGGCLWKQALSKGAVAAFIGQNAARISPSLPLDVVYILPSPESLWAGELIASFWDRPSSKIPLIGVTGTNGKTTTTYLIDYLARSAGMQAALFGTLINKWPDYIESSTHTTSFADVLQEKLASAVLAGSQIGVMEVSSHSLSQNRVAGCRFSGAVFTNLTQDHLDYHSSMEKYFESKALLFDAPLLVGLEARTVVNIDNEWGLRLSKRLGKSCWTCSLDHESDWFSSADLSINEIQITSLGLKGLLHSPVGDGRFTTPLLGHFNLMNLLQAIGILLQQGLPLDKLLNSAADFPGVPGRMERVRVGQLEKKTNLPIVLVDYAHTPDALKNALTSLRPFVKGKLICVFGCGGDRDRSKRDQMGAIAFHFSDALIVTSDNPRTEDPLEIINDIVRGIPQPSNISIEERRDRAIKRAIEEASINDLVLIAGKGHETYQIFENEKIDFDDREFAKKALISKIRN